MAKTGQIGSKMNRRPGVVINRQPDDNTHDANRQWMKEAQDRLEAPITQIDAATAKSLTAAGAVSGATLAATGAVTGASVVASGGVSGASVTASGTVSGAAVTASGTVSGAAVTASGTVSGAAVTATGALTGATLSVSGAAGVGALTASSAHVTGNEQVDGNLTVTGTLSATYGAVSATTLTTAEADVHHAARTLQIGPAVGIPNGAWTYNALGTTGAIPSWSSPASAANTVEFSVPLIAGDRITSITARVRSSGAGNMSMRAWKCPASNTAPTQLGTTQTSSGASTDQSLTISGLTETVAAGTHYVVAVNGSASASGALVYEIEVTYDRP